MREDDWTAFAMSDVSLVADLLVHLRQATSPEKKNKNSPSPPLTWQLRQRRSRPVTHSVTETESPKTPLSWSGATSASGGGFDDAVTVTDKVFDANENTTSKRSGKKKTLAEVKEDEAFVLKERENLKKKLASLRAAVELERSTNDRLKRLKLDYVSFSVKSVPLHVPAEENLKMVSSYGLLSAHLGINGSTFVEQPGLNIPPEPCEEVMNRENKFLLPDLNLPIEDHTT